MTRAVANETQELDSGGSIYAPPWLVNVAAVGWRVIAIAAVLIVAGFIVSTFWIVTATIAVACVVAAVFAPIVLRLRAQGRSRNSAALIVWVTAIGVITLLLVVLGIAFFPYIAQLLQAVDNAVQTIKTDLSQAGLPPAATDVIRIVGDAVRKLAAEPLGAVAASIASAATIAILAVFLLFFVLRDGDKAWLWVFQDLGEDKRTEITVAGHDALNRVGGYLIGTTILAAIAGVTTFIFLMLLGVPLALPLAVLVFFGGYVPYFGGLVTNTIVLVVTFATGGLATAAVLLGLMAVRGLIVGYGIRPALYGRTVSIHPAVVLLVLPAGFQIAGAIGLFAAVPVTAIFLAVARAVRQILEPDQTASLPALVPGWLDRLAQFSWRLVVVAGLVAIVIAIAVALPLVVTPVIFGLVLAATLSPVGDWLVERGLSRTKSAALAVGGGLLAIAAMLVLAALSLVDNGSGIGNAIASGGRDINDASGGQLGGLSDVLGTASLSLVQAILAFGQSLAAIGIIVLLSALLAFYFMRDGGNAWQGVTSRVGPGSVDDVRAAGRRAFDALSGYMIGTAAISLVGAASQWLIMVLLGLPYAAPVFVLSFFLCFIPYIGGYLTTGIAFLIAVGTHDPVTILIMFTWTMVFNIVQGNVIAPVVYGRTVNIHPAVVLMAIPAGSAVAGIMGMFIAVPAVGVFVATWRTVLRLLAGRRAALEPRSEPEKDVPEAVEPAPTIAIETAGA